MFDFLKKTEKLPRDIKKLLKPRQEFTKQTKTAFLAVFDAAHSTAVPAGTARGFTNLVKSLIACGALIAVFASVSVYADTANVAADSPLYPLKRLDESVQLAVAPASEKAQLQATFATRRASELTDLEVRKPSSTAAIVGLSNDLNTALNASLSDAQTAKLGDGQLTSVCEKVLSAMTTSTSSTRLFSVRGNVIGRFVNQCGRSIAISASSTGNASGTFSVEPPFSWETSTSSLMATPTSTPGSSTRPYRDGNSGSDDGSKGGSGGHFYRVLPGTVSASTSITVSSTARFPFLRL